jgi:hypothetical protein
MWESTSLKLQVSPAFVGTLVYNKLIFRKFLEGPTANTVDDP